MLFCPMTLRWPGPLITRVKNLALILAWGHRDPKHKWADNSRKQLIYENQLLLDFMYEQY